MIDAQDRPDARLLDVVVGHIEGRFAGPGDGIAIELRGDVPADELRDTVHGQVADQREGGLLPVLERPVLPVDRGQDEGGDRIGVGLERVAAQVVVPARLVTGQGAEVDIPAGAGRGSPLWSR